MPKVIAIDNKAITATIASAASNNTSRGIPPIKNIAMQYPTRPK